MSLFRVFNLEADLPTLEEARKRLSAATKEARREGCRALKIIHGYGSSGKGGVLKIGLRKSLLLRKKEGAIKDFIPGEDFSIFNQTTLDLLEAVPQLRGDPDLNALNEGVTLVWVR